MSRTRLIRRYLVALGAPALLAVCSPASARAPQTSFVTPALASDATSGRLLFSQCPQGTCNLYTQINGRTSELPIAPFGLPDDAAEATLGVGPHGHEVAAYSRCRPNLHKCALYMYDFAAGVEKRLPVSNHGGAFMTPSVSGDRVAYAYNGAGRDGPARSYGIYWSYLNGTRLHRVHTEPLNPGIAQPTLALQGRRLAYAGYSLLTVCFGQSRVRIAQLGTSRDTLVATGTTRTEVFSPHWANGVLYYGRDYFTRKSYRHDFKRSEIVRSRVERYTPTSASTAATNYSSLAITSVLPTTTEMFFQLATNQASSTGLYAAGTLRFHAIAAHRRLTRVR